ncbi:hypothetical protein KFL_005010030 [Klebsormidium nitens]|uniref:Uncharacterized protein n=1 Tax=Klebsormidium nitens TaxID=105231 RepID=A0A1Y1IE46_KLENI|nr:hypothetical protein KFL_005010030 [Klebsormidium nitens]|eukprot:GAQ89234.1 hypothetical protein KFL_005010030 [Klebsormidium nitens]
MERHLEEGSGYDELSTQNAAETSGGALLRGHTTRLNGWGAGVADISAWSAMLSSEARRLERHGMEADKDSVALLRQLASEVLKIQEHIDAKDGEVRALHKKLADQRRAREALEILKQHVEKLEERCQKRIDETAVLRKKLREQARDDETAALRKKLREQASLLKCRTTTENNHRERVTAKSTRIARLLPPKSTLASQKRDDETVALRKKLREQASLLDRSTTTENTLRDRVTAKETAAAAAQRVLEEQMDEMGGHVAALREDAEKREEQRRRLEAELKVAVEKEARSQDRQAELSATVDALKAQLAKSTAEIARQSEQLAGRGREVSDVRMELARVREQLRTAELEREAQRERFEEKEGEWESVIRQADERLVEADVTILDLRRTLTSLEQDLAHTRDAADVTARQLTEHERSADDLARAQAGAISHLEEDLRRTQCELADLRDEHAMRAAPEVEREFVEEIERLDGQLETAREEARAALGDATEAVAARDAAERRLLHVVAHVADEASDLRHLLSHATSPQSASYKPSAQQGLLGEGPETPIPEPAGMALSTLAVTARKTVLALREVREREGRLEEELEAARQRLEHVERERLVSTTVAKDLKLLLEKAQEVLERRNSDGETERKEAQERNAALLGRCSQLERQQRTLVEAVAAACAALQGLGVPEDLRSGGGAEEEGFRRPESLTGLQVSLAEQTESVGAAHATLVRLARRLQSDSAELSDCKAEAERALDKARENEAQLRLRLQTSEEALSRAKAALEMARERHRDELRGLKKEWEERREGEVARAADEKEEVTQELESSRAIAHQLLGTVQLLVRYAAPVRQKLADVRWAKAVVSAQLRASVLQVQQMQTAFATLQETLLGKANEERRENGRFGSVQIESHWDEKGVYGGGKSHGRNGFRGVNGDFDVDGVTGVNAHKDGLNHTGFAEGLAPKARLRAGVWAVVAHLRLLSLGRFSVNQTVTKVCRESVPLLPRGSVRLDREMMMAVAGAGAGCSAREEAEAVVKLLDTAQKSSRQTSPPPVPRSLPGRSKASADSFRTLVERITRHVDSERTEHSNLIKALHAAGASTAKEHAAARLWETEARKYGELIAYMEERERQLQADLSRSVPLEEHRRIVDELKRMRAEAEGVVRERAEVGRELTSQIKVASHLRTQLSDAREAVHGKILATDRLTLELAKERQQLARLRESAAAQEAHHKRLQEDYEALVESLRDAEKATLAAKRDVDERADVARRLEQKAATARKHISHDGPSERESQKALSAVQSEAAAAKREAALSQQWLRRQSDLCEELTGKSQDMQRQLLASREHALTLRRELQSAIEREVAERTDRASWARARSELQAVRSAAEEQLAELIDTGPAQESAAGVKTLDDGNALGGKPGDREGGSRPAESRVNGRNDLIKSRRLGEENEGRDRSLSKGMAEKVESRREYSHSRKLTDGIAAVQGMESPRVRTRNSATSWAVDEVETARKSSVTLQPERMVGRSRVESSGGLPSAEGSESAAEEKVSDWLSQSGNRDAGPVGSLVTDSHVGLERKDGSGTQRLRSVSRQSDEKSRKISSATAPIVQRQSRKPAPSLPEAGSVRVRSASVSEKKIDKLMQAKTSPSVKDMISELRKLATMQPAI